MKRLIDVFLSASALIVLSPLLLVTSALVFVKLGNPVLFVQERPGLGGKPFKMVKFRSMTNARDSGGELMSDEERLSTFGRFLRSTSIDELPELLNVLRGEMSVVGPRPLLMRYLPLYNAHQKRRHEVKPGITGWAQINGRNNIDWDLKFDLDVWYVDNQSMKLDFYIILATFFKILTRSNVSKEGKATTDFFSGNAAQITDQKGPFTYPD